MSTATATIVRVPRKKVLKTLSNTIITSLEAVETIATVSKELGLGIENVSKTGTEYSALWLERAKFSVGDEKSYLVMLSNLKAKIHAEALAEADMAKSLVILDSLVPINQKLQEYRDSVD